MILIHVRDGAQMVEHSTVEVLQRSPRPAVVWIDLVDPTPAEVKATETFIGTALMTPLQAAEIESSSRFFEEPPTEFQLNTHFLQPSDKGWRSEPVTFALREQVLVTRRNGPLHSFTELARRRTLVAHADWTGYDTFIALFNLRIDDDADGLIDCVDPNCALQPACFGTENCANGTDDNGNGFTDCEEPACIIDPSCR